MKKVTFEFTVEELGILTTMASDQLFRKQFIDSKMPGYRINREELDLCKSLVGRLRSVVDEQRVKNAAAAPVKASNPPRVSASAKTAVAPKPAVLQKKAAAR